MMGLEYTMEIDRSDPDYFSVRHVPSICPPRGKDKNPVFSLVE